VHHALEAGYVWDPHFVSVSNKEVRQPREDDKFANAMHAIENIVLNFIEGRESEMDKAIRERLDRQQLARTSPPQGGSMGWMA
jgi:hypothetical protein